MGTSTTSAQFTAKIAAAAVALSNAPSTAIRDAVRVCEQTLDGAIAGMVGGDMTARNAPSAKRPRRMRARGGEMKTGRGMAVTRAKVGPSGPVALIDQGAPGHLIGVGRGQQESQIQGRLRFRTIVPGTGRAYNLNNAPKRLRINGEWRMGPVIHPGTGGKRRWTRVRDTVLPKLVAPKVWAVHTKAVAGAFGGRGSGQTYRPRRRY